MNVAFIAPLREHVVVLTLKSFYFASVVRGSIAEEVIDLIALMANRYRSASILQRHQPNQQLSGSTDILYTDTHSCRMRQIAYAY